MITISGNQFTLWFVWMLLQPVTDNNLFNKWATKRRYYLRNVDVCKRRAKAHRNSEAGRAWIRCWQNNRCRENLQHKLEKNTRTRIWWALQAQHCRSKNVTRLLGCTVDEFKTHIESQFTPEMNWENWGTVWEIDHIKPCVKFDLTDPSQREACFHFSNQRPLTVFANRSKGAR